MATRPGKAKRLYGLKPKARSGGYVRERSMDEYHTSRWTRAARAFKASHPLCEECKRKGIIQAAEVVDHIIPAPLCEDFYDESNWQSLCRRCNAEKGNRDKKLFKEKRK
jgi:5-methylcytosine-specific restriction protein A